MYLRVIRREPLARRRHCRLSCRRSGAQARHQTPPIPDISKTQRWLDLIALLLGRKVPLAVDEIIERVPAYAEPWSTGDATKRATVRRMFERDKDELRTMGIPIESVRYEINYGAEQLEGYRITRRDFYLPYLRVIGGEPGEGSGQRSEYPGLRGIDLEPDEARLALEGLRHVAELRPFRSPRRPVRRSAN